jgi:hypothetical protein
MSRKTNLEEPTKRQRQRKGRLKQSRDDLKKNKGKWC